MNNTATLFKSKSMGVVVDPKPKHGSVGWLDGGSKLVEYVFIRSKGWIPVEEYRLEKQTLKIKNIAYYRDHPSDLSKKIRSKKPIRDYFV